MTRFKHDLILRIMKTLDAVLVTIPFALCWYLYYAKHIASPFYAKGDYLVVALFFVLFIIFGRVYDALFMSMQRISEIVYAQFLAVAVSDFIMYIVIWLLSKHLPNILPGVAALIGQVILAAVWAYNAHHAYFKIFPPQATAVIYDIRQGMEKLIGKYGLDDKYKVVLTATADECIANLAMLDGVSTVFMSGIHSHDRNVILKYCVENNIGTFVIPRIGDTIMSGAYPMHMFHLPMLKVGRYHPQPEYLFIKRLLDIVISAVALVVLSPIFLVTAIAIKATDHGPVFYKHVVGGRVVLAVNLRVAGQTSFCLQAQGKLRHFLTVLGSNFRAFGAGTHDTKLAFQNVDKLRQLIYAASANHLTDRRDAVIMITAGQTGYAVFFCVNAHTAEFQDAKLLAVLGQANLLVMDLMYIAHPSIVEDLKIMFATVKILFMPESTEGISEGQTTAMSGENH